MEALRFRRSMAKLEAISYAEDGAPRWSGPSTTTFDQKSLPSLPAVIKQWWHQTKRPVSCSMPRDHRGGGGEAQGGLN